MQLSSQNSIRPVNAMLFKRLQTTLHMINSMQCCPKGSRQHGTQKIQAMLSEQHLVFPFTYITYQVFLIKKTAIILLINLLAKALNSSSTFYPLTSQTSCWMLSKQLKLSVSHSMLPKPMQSYLSFSVKCWEQDCISC